MTHLRLQVWGIRGLAIYQTANITVNFYDIFCNEYISACIRAKICGKYFENFSAAQILLKIFTEIFAVHNFFCKKMRKKIRKFQRCEKNFANIYGIFCGAQNFLQKNAEKNTETISISYMEQGSHFTSSTVERAAYRLSYYCLFQSPLYLWIFKLCME